MKADIEVGTNRRQSDSLERQRMSELLIELKVNVQNIKEDLNELKTQGSSDCLQREQRIQQLERWRVGMIRIMTAIGLSTGGLIIKTVVSHLN